MTECEREGKTAVNSQQLNARDEEDCLSHGQGKGETKRLAMEGGIMPTQLALAKLNTLSSSRVKKGHRIRDHRLVQTAAIWERLISVMHGCGVDTEYSRCMQHCVGPPPVGVVHSAPRIIR